MTKALLIIDTQVDFCEGGSLAVEGGAAVTRKISQHYLTNEDEYAFVVGTKDWHIDPGSHFSDSPDFVDSWPVHCVANTEGSSYHKNLDVGPYGLDGIFYKGMYDAAYSGFEGINGRSFEAGVSLERWLRERNVTEVDIVGIALDYCVKATALDAAKLGFKTTVLTKLTVPVHRDPDKLAALYREFMDAGVHAEIRFDV